MSDDDLTQKRTAEWLAEVDAGRGPRGPDLVRTEVEKPLAEALRLMTKALRQNETDVVADAFADRYGQASRELIRTEVERPLTEAIHHLACILAKLTDTPLPTPPAHPDRFLPVNRTARPGPPPVAPKAPPVTRVREERNRARREQQAKKGTGETAQ